MLFGKKTERYKGVGSSQQKSLLDEDSTDSADPSNEKLSLEADVVDFDESLDDVTVDTPVSGRPKVMSVTIKDRKTLHAAYMPFLQSGGIFVPTTGKYKMGDEIFLLLKLVESPENVSIPGKVVWITPEGAMSHRVAGIGIQFTGPDAAKVRTRIEGILGGALKSRRMTHTM